MHMVVYMTVHSPDWSPPEKNMAMYMMYMPVYTQELEEHSQQRTLTEAQHTPVHLKGWEAEPSSNIHDQKKR